MTGNDHERYALARRVLLDTLDALEEQRAALVLVGAQAIYLHTGALELAVAAATFDADLAIDPALLKSAPALADALRAAGFVPRDQPGIWESVAMASRSICWFLPLSLAWEGAALISATSTAGALPAKLVGWKRRLLTMLQ